MGKIIRTKLAITVRCKCGSCIAATMLYGGIEIGSDFTNTIAKCANNGGVIEVVNTDIRPIILSECKC